MASPVVSLTCTVRVCMSFYHSEDLEELFRRDIKFNAKYWFSYKHKIYLLCIEIRAIFNKVELRKSEQRYH